MADTCWYATQRTSKPFWSDDFELTREHFSFLALHMVFITLFSRGLHFLLKPLRQPLIISQLLIVEDPLINLFRVHTNGLNSNLAGIIFGPTALGRFHLVRKWLFPSDIQITMDTIVFFTTMFYLFKVGVTADPFVIKRSGKIAVAIGVSCFVTSLSFGLLAKNYLDSCTFWKDKLTVSEREHEMPQRIAVFNAFTSFPVVAIALTDMNIINSDLGHLATASSMIANLLHYAAHVMMTVMKLISEKSYNEALGVISSIAGLGVFYFFVVRSASLCVISRTPEGKPVKEIYIFCILVLVLICGFVSEIIGQSALVGAFLLGLAIPDGPPLGAVLVEKLHYLITLMFMPLQVGILGLKTDISVLEFWEFGYLWGAEVIALACFVGKIVGVGLPALWWHLPLRDAFLLGLIMNIKGIVELSVLNVWTDSKKNYIDIQTNTIEVFTIMFVTGAITPLVKYFYDPSEKYLANNKRSILHVKDSHDFRVVVCVHNQDDVPPIIRLLKLSIPTNSTNLSLFILHLVELVGRAAPLLITHPPRKTPSPNPTRTERIINVFRKFEQRFQSQVSVRAFSSICPYSSMHIDIISMAVDKSASLVIIPFHRGQKDNDDSIGPTSNHSLKIIIQNLLDRAPCTVGILIDFGGSVVTDPILVDPLIYHIAVLFMGGADDREALAYAMNLIEHPCVNLTVIRFVAAIDTKGINRTEMSLDNHAIDHFRYNMMSTGRTLYKEEEVVDGVELSWAIRSMKDECDLIIVGRRQTTNSILISGLDEWNECEELGILGDMLSSPEFMDEGSLLVVQQYD